MGDWLKLGYGLLGYSLEREREIIRIEFLRVFSFKFFYFFNRWCS